MVTFMAMFSGILFLWRPTTFLAWWVGMDTWIFVPYFIIIGTIFVFPTKKWKWVTVQYVLAIIIGNVCVEYTMWAS